MLQSVEALQHNYKASQGGISSRNICIENELSLPFSNFRELYY